MKAKTVGLCRSPSELAPAEFIQGFDSQQSEADFLRWGGGGGMSQTSLPDEFASFFQATDTLWLPV